MADDFAKVLSDTARDHKFILLGDTNHREGALLQFAARPAHIRALAAQGVKHFFLEQGEGINPSFEKYQDGQLSRDEMRKMLNLYAPATVGGMVAVSLMKEERESRIDGMMQLLDAANQNGVRVHAIYDGASGVEMQALMRATEEFGNRIMADMKAFITDPALLLELNELTMNKGGLNTVAQSTRLSELVANWMEAQPQDYKDAAMARYNDQVESKQAAFAKARMDADAGIAARMQAITGNDKAAIFYGAAHGMHTDDLDDHLPGAARILLATDSNYADFLRPSQDILMDKTRQPDPRPAVGMYLLKEQRFVPGSRQGIDDFCSSGLVDVSGLSLCDKPVPVAPAAVAAVRGPKPDGP